MERLNVSLMKTLAVLEEQKVYQQNLVAKIQDDEEVIRKYKDKLNDVTDERD